MKLTSPAFASGQNMPVMYSCDGANINPPLKFEAVPVEARSLVLIMDDPDVPEYIRADGVWDHWIVFDIPPEVTEVHEGQMPPGVPGQGTGGDRVYVGPCPPDGAHRYCFRLYALDQELSIKPGSSKAEVVQAMRGHVLEIAELIGMYNRLGS